MTDQHPITLALTSSEVVSCGSGRDRRAKFRLSDNSLDRMGTRIEPEGIDTAGFQRNPVFLWGHGGYGTFSGPPDIANVIGRTLSTRISALDRGAGDATKALDIEVEFMPGSINEKAEQALQMVRKGYLNAVSIGLAVRDFVVEKGPDHKGQKTSIIVYTDTEMLEASLVPIPANSNALALQKSFPALYPDHQSSDGLSAVMRWLTSSRPTGSPRPARADIDPKAVVQEAHRLQQVAALQSQQAQSLKDAIAAAWGQDDD